MKFHDSFLDEIRNRLSVSDVVSRRVRLKRQGREFIGLSPFKQEKTPSFTINDQKGFYHCFASGEHGDIFSFLQKTEGLSFPESVERLAQEAGLELPKPDPAYERFEKKRTTLYEVMDAACNFFEANFNAMRGSVARDYAHQRGLTDSTIAEFRVGYIGGSSTALKDELLKTGVTEDQLLECGLIIKPDDGRSSFDRFRNRLMIPIQDSRGNVIAFGGRAIGDGVKPKYLNSPETSLFKKGSIVFNFHRARGPSFEVNEVVVVEGYLDAIAVYQAGMKNVVATLGTTLTERQFGLLWKLCPEPIICFDGDKAGGAAAHRAVDRMLPALTAGRSFRFAFLPDNKDPDDLVRMGGLTQFKTILETSLPLTEVFWRREIAAFKIDTPERKAALEVRIKKLVDSIRDEAVHRQYAFTFRVRLGRLFWESDRSQQAEDRSEILRALNIKGTQIERIFLGILVQFPLIFERILDPVEKLELSCDLYQEFKDELIRIIQIPEDTNVSTFYTHISENFFKVLDEIHGEENIEDGRQYGHNLFRRFPLLNMRPDDDFVESCAELFLKMLQYKQMRDHIEEAMRDYESDMHEDNESRLLNLVESVENHEAQILSSERELVEWAGSIRSMFHGNQEHSLEKVIERIRS